LGADAAKARKCGTEKQQQCVPLILSWYGRSARRLPWRGIKDPYRILLSEIMLQQTQVSRVLEKYPAFLHTFPTIRSLAAARRSDVVRAWQGMGYNNRAVRLHTLAKIVVAEHTGRIPRDYDALLALPGIGPYTARAVLSSAFGLAVPIVDVNVQRFLSRVFWRMPGTSSLRSSGEIWTLAHEILPSRSAYNWNQALMDAGATICTARSPRCPICPSAGLCASRTSMIRTSTPANSREPSFAGIPHRIYRGRIVERLRSVPGGGSIRIDLLGRAVFPGFSPRDRHWLLGLLANLESDGLVHVKGDGGLTTTRIKLA
jgi:A/G-specific adenine glycosylase